MSIQIDRGNRDSETREATKSLAPWKPPSILPDPEPEQGYVFRYVRTAIAGVADKTNVSRQFREGYVPVRAEDQKNMMLDANGSGNIEIGGLLLCKIPEETVNQRAAYYENQSNQQIQSVDNNFMRENDPRMPLLRSERSSKVSFGTGSKE